MLSNFDLDYFIRNYVTRRAESLLKWDMENRHNDLVERLNGKKVLVIGGAGTIGASYIKAILKFKVGQLVVADVNENGLTELVRDLRSSTGYNMPGSFITYPINFSSRVFTKMFRSLGPFDIVANFAAHKHVRSEKDVFSIQAMIENNVFNARKLLDLLLEFPPAHFFCVSTDKAANPVNIMGASKKLMEELIMAFSEKLPVTTARFANVAFSNGSLPQGFIERINKSQPLSCPVNIRRFFVSPRESGELCMIASVLGDSGNIIFPKLDRETDMITFKVIAEQLLKYMGREPEVCLTEEEARSKALKLKKNSATYPVYYFETDTTGEKPYEEFYTENEVIDNNCFEKLGVIKHTSGKSLEEIDRILDQLDHDLNNNNITKARIVETLESYLPDFGHIEKGRGLDQKM